MPLAEQFEKIVRMWQRGMLTVTEARKAIYKAVARHKYSDAAIAAATEALKQL